MINMIAGIVNSEQFVPIAETGSKGAQRKDFKSVYYGRVNAVTSVHPVTNLKNDMDKENQGLYTTKIEKDEEGKQTIVMMAGHQIYRQINLDGLAEEEMRIINPVHVKRAYLMD